MPKFISDTDFAKLHSEAPGDVKILFDPSGKLEVGSTYQPPSTFGERLAAAPGNVIKSFSDPNNPGAGFIKGRVRNLTSASRKIGEAVETYSNIDLSKKIAEFIKELQDSSNRLNEQYLSMPDNDPQKALLLEDIKRTQETIQKFSDQMPKSAAPKSAVIADLFKPKGGGQAVGDTIGSVGEFVLGAKAPTTGLFGLPAADPAIRTATLAAKNANKISSLVQHGLNILGSSALQGVSAGIVAGYQGKDLPTVGKTSVVAGALSVPFQALNEYRNAVADALKASAEKSANQALNATTKADKIKSAKIAPELVKRNIVYTSRGNLLKQAEENIDITGQKLEDAYAALPPGNKENIAPLLQDIQDAKNDLIIKGTNTVSDPKTWRALEEEQIKLLDITRQQQTLSVEDVTHGFQSTASEPINPEITTESLRSARQLLDRIIKGAKGGYGLSGQEGAILEAQKITANSIRDLLAQNHPEIGALNAEYTFWKNVESVVSNTILRTTGQAVPLGEKIAEGAGATAGFVQSGGDVSTAGLLGGGYRLFVKVLTSPAYRQVSAVLKDGLADALASNNATQAIQLLNQMAVSVAGTSVNSKQKNPKFISDEEFNKL